MIILSKNIMDVRPGRTNYIVSVRDYENTEENNDNIIDYCDTANFGGDVYRDSVNGDVINLLVAVYTD